ncbi:MAG TPA: aspartyl protease family protein [Smithellaceae bacterium]|nr:aspartyl protease family protein [Smithellaceae bacterium]HPL68328.1 aspartyl protease family protein [Smithellaceae bacterium]
MQKNTKQSNKQSRISVQSTLIMFFLLALLVSGCAGMKSVSIIRGGSAEQDVLSQVESVKANHLAHFLTVKVRINDSSEDLLFLVDTGAITVIDKQTADKFTFTDSVVNEFTDIAGNKKEVRLVRVGKMSIGKIRVSDCAAAIIDLKKHSPRIDGILGSNFLRYFKVELDYQNSQLVFHGNSGNQTLDGFIAIPIWQNMKQGFAPTTKCILDGSIDVVCMIDTGHDKAVSLPLSIIQKTTGFKDGKYIESNGGMSGGLFETISKSYLIKAEKISAGNLTINNSPVTTNASDNLMTLGYAYLKNFRIVIDYPNSVAYFKPFPELKPESKYLSFGFRCSKEKGKTIVTGIWKGSVADNAGLSIGDELVSLNNKDVTTLSMMEIMEMMNSSSSLNVSYLQQSSAKIANSTLHKDDLMRLL